MANSFEMIAKTFQGFEEVLAKELTELGADQVEIIKRGVRFYGDQELLYKANFRCRTALRILKPFYHFEANGVDEVYETIKAFDWSQYLTPKKTFAIDAVVFSDTFKHSKFLAYKVKDAIADHFMEKTGERPSVRINHPDIQLNIHVAQETCTLSLDSSGDSLHMRGYRAEQTEAPLNEVLAAGMLKLAGWDGQCDFMDPMCGSGTIAIEAAMMALNIAPGIYRHEFAFEKWPDFNKELLEELYNDDSLEREFTHKVYASDISAAAIRVAEENIKSAGLNRYITLERKPFQSCERPNNETLVMFNPPYGERLRMSDLAGLYEEIGTKLKHDFTDMAAWIITVSNEATDKIGLRPSVKYQLLNGSIECEFRKYEMFKGRRNEFLRERNDRHNDSERSFNSDSEEDNRNGVFLRTEEDTWKRETRSEDELSEYHRRRHEAFEKRESTDKTDFDKKENRDEKREFHKKDGDRRPFNRERNDENRHSFKSEGFKKENDHSNSDHPAKRERFRTRDHKDGFKKDFPKQDDNQIKRTPRDRDDS